MQDMKRIANIITITFGLLVPIQVCLLPSLACVNKSSFVYTVNDDFCNAAKSGATKATAFMQTRFFAQAIQKILSAAADGNEHCIAFGKDKHDSVIISTMVSGQINAVKLPETEGKFTDIHNHPQNSPPSSGDFYDFVAGAIKNPAFDIRYIVTNNGKAVYALLITRLKNAVAFTALYPKQYKVKGYQPGFPEKMQEEYYDIIQLLKGWHKKTATEAAEMALAYMLNHYNAGVALLKMDANGEFKAINTTKNITKGSNPFMVTICP